MRNHVYRLTRKKKIVSFSRISNRESRHDFSKTIFPLNLNNFGVNNEPVMAAAASCNSSPYLDTRPAVVTQSDTTSRIGCSDYDAIMDNLFYMEA